MAFAREAFPASLHTNAAISAIRPMPTAFIRMVTQSPSNCPT